MKYANPVVKYPLYQFGMILIFSDPDVIESALILASNLPTTLLYIQNHRPKSGLVLFFMYFCPEI